MALLGGSEVGVLRFLDHRADPEHLGAATQRAGDRAGHLLAAVERHRAGVDRLASGRLFEETRDVEVAIGGHHQRARDRRRAHQQRIGVMPLRRQCQALLDAEAVLLVDDRQRQVAEDDILLHQRVRADDDGE